MYSQISFFWRIVIAILLLLTALSMLTQGPRRQANILVDTMSISLHSQNHPKDNILDVKNQTLGFEKILVISMPNRLDKHDVWSMASLYTNISIEYVDGVRLEDLPEKARPNQWEKLQKEGPGTVGCYRGHLNAAQRIVSERLSSALIMEDDADWDVMLKDQLVEFAKGARYVRNSNNTGLDSPYGDDWDMLWLGHCGIKNDAQIDGRYYAVKDDPTVIPKKYRSNRGRWPNMSPPELDGNFTRIVYEPAHSLCAFAYALSLKGAEKLLYHYSLEMEKETLVWDRALDRYCGAHQSGAQCVGVFPAIFESYRAAGNMSRDSDRDNVGAGRWREKAETKNLVFPLKVNIGRFVTRQKTFKAQYQEGFMLPEINILEAKMPEGRPAFIKKEAFATGRF